VPLFEPAVKSMTGGEKLTHFAAFSPVLLPVLPGSAQLGKSFLLLLLRQDWIWKALAL